MDAFNKWFAEIDDSIYDKLGLAEDAFRAGMRAAAEIVAERARKGAIMRVGDPVGLTKLRDAILAEADKP